MKKVFIGILIAGLLVVVICFCSLNSRRYLKFNYIGESDYTTLDYYSDVNLTDDCEFTWWEYFEDEDEHTIEVINDFYGANFSNEILNYTDRKGDFIISFGRKLKMIYYDKKSDKGVGYDERLIIGVPVFEKEYNKKIYIYSTEKKYNVYPPEFANDDYYKFNWDGDVRYECE